LRRTGRAVWRVGSTIGKSAPAAGAMDQFKAEVMPQSRRVLSDIHPHCSADQGRWKGRAGSRRPAVGRHHPTRRAATGKPGPAPGSALEGRTAAAPHAVRQEALALRRVRWSSARQRRHGERPPDTV